MQSVAVWIQAIATTLVAAVTLWVVFFSEVGDLAVEILRADLLEARREMKQLSEEKQQLSVEKQQLLTIRQQLESQSQELERQREEHVAHVVNGYLRELWEVGLRHLVEYRNLAEVGQELKGESEKFSPLRNWRPNSTEKIPQSLWTRSLPNPSNIYKESRNEWGELLISWSHKWDCSKERVHISMNYDDIPFDPQGSKVGTRRRAELVDERYRKFQLEYQKRLAAFNISCFDEWEQAVRRQIAGKKGKDALKLREFSQDLLSWSGLRSLSQSAKNQIREKIMRELNINHQLSTLPIQLKLSRSASLEEIKVQASQILVNVNRARDWLDRATRDRRRWGAE